MINLVGSRQARDLSFAQSACLTRDISTMVVVRDILEAQEKMGTLRLHEIVCAETLGLAR